MNHCLEFAFTLSSENNCKIQDLKEDNLGHTDKSSQNQ